MAGINRLPAVSATFLPTAVEPVKAITSTDSTSAAPTSPFPWTTWTRSGGRPAAAASSGMRAPVSGDFSDGLSTTEQPAASAVISGIMERKNG